MVKCYTIAHINLEGHIIMFKNAQEFIALVGSSQHMEAYEWIKKDPIHISSLFKNVSEFIELVDTSFNKKLYEGIGGEVAYQLISAQSDAIVLLFKKDTDLIQLDKINHSPALALCNLQSKAVATLFNNVDLFIRLASEADLNLACTLIEKQRDMVFPLFKNKANILKLIEANRQVAGYLEAAMQCSPNVTKGLLKDLFPPVKTVYNLTTPEESFSSTKNK